MASKALKPVVLLLGKLEHPESISLLSKLSPYITVVPTPSPLTPESFTTAATAGAFTTVTHLFRTFYSFSKTPPLTPSLLSHLPNLRHIVSAAAGYDTLPISHLTENKIAVYNTPDVTETATADTALWLLLSSLRRFSEAQNVMRDGGWFLQCPHGHDPEHKTLGIVGLGGIGKALATRVKPLGMKVVYYNRRRLHEEKEGKLGVEYASFEELLEKSDVVSVHVPLSDATKGLIGKKEFGRMKKGVTVINTARGGIVDEEALVEALKEEKVACYAGDVWEGEPNGVREEWRDGRWGGRVVALPHVGTHTVETRGKMELRGLRNLVLSVGKREEVFGEIGGWRMDIIPEQRAEEWVSRD